MTDGNFETISAELSRISEVHEHIAQFRRLISQFQLELQNQQQTAEFLQRCELAANHLVNELKTHTEELRLINQDINHLEDLVKSHRNSHADQKLEVTKKYHVFRRNLLHFNSNINELKMPNGCLINEDFVETPEWLSETNNQTAGFSNSGLINPLLSFSRFFGNNPQVVGNFSKLFPPGPSFIGRPHHQEDPSKLKNCQFCAREIHRNSPVCPHCKQKSSSLRNPRRPKKKTP